MTSNTPAGTRILGSLRSADGVGVVRIEDRFDADIDESGRRSLSPSGSPAGTAMSRAS